MTVSANQLLALFYEQNATDIYLTVGSAPTFRYGNNVRATELSALSTQDVLNILSELLSPEELAQFETSLEYNSAFTWQDKMRIRINVFQQQRMPGAVMRRIQTSIPTLEELNLSRVYADLSMEKRGLILVTGPTGSGKSTSLASMLEHRNQHGTGHIVTIEDPVEYLHTPKNCIITQRDVGIDTHSFHSALKNMLRQTPDVIVIGEIRDRETMEHALSFAETGHLCLATLHAGNTNQTIERIINFFPEDRHKQILLSLSLNLRAILSQRLLANNKGSRSIALEIMLNNGLIKSLIQEGKLREIKNCIENNRIEGMQSFDQALINLYIAGTISEKTAISESDNPANVRLAITQLKAIEREHSEDIKSTF